MQLCFKTIRTKKTINKIKATLTNLPTRERVYDYTYNEAMRRIKGYDPDSKELAKLVLS